MTSFNELHETRSKDVTRKRPATFPGADAGKTKDDSLYVCKNLPLH